MHKPKTGVTAAAMQANELSSTSRIPPNGQRDVLTQQSVDIEEKPNTVASSFHPAFLAEHLSDEWIELMRCLLPVDPSQDKIEVFENIQLYLDEISTWLNLLHSNLPRTSLWMSTLSGLSEVQRHSALYYYETKIKQVSNHVRTLRASDETILNVLLMTFGDSLEDKVKLDELHQTVGHLKAQCHITWLQLLELTACLEYNSYPSKKSNVKLYSENSRSHKYQNPTFKIHRTHRSENHGEHPRRSKTHDMRSRLQSFKVLSNPMKNIIWMKEDRRTGHRQLDPKLPPVTRMRANAFCQNFIHLLK